MLKFYDILLEFMRVRGVVNLGCDFMFCFDIEYIGVRGGVF